MSPYFYSDSCTLYYILAKNLAFTRRKTDQESLHLQENGKQTWIFHVMQLICTNGFGEVWFQQGVSDVGACFRQRLIDQYTQGWATDIETKKKLEFYSSFKRVYFRVKNT